MTYEELHKACRLFGLAERATLREIKSRHRELVKLHHPDVGGGDDPDQIRLINAAYKTLLEYSESYLLSFTENEFYEQNPEERLRMQFADVPLWGSK